MLFGLMLENQGKPVKTDWMVSNIFLDTAAILGRYLFAQSLDWNFLGGASRDFHK